MVVSLGSDSTELLASPLKVEPLMFSCPESKLFFILMNSLVRVHLSI